MPAVPTYLRRLRNAIDAIEALQDELVDRRGIEEAFGAGKWTAWRIMRRCGAMEGPGNTLVCRRGELLEHLRGLEKDGRFGPEIERRQKVEAYLESMARFAGRKHQQVAVDAKAEELLSSRFGSLPQGVELRANELRIEFSGTADFLQKFGAVVFALQNDYEAISNFIEKP